jgi:hypothetical protein
MKLVDLNLLVYAVNRDAPQHAAARSWLEGVLSGDEPIALAWPVILGFLRITTHRRVLTRPLSADQALRVMDGWLSEPLVKVLVPGAEHWRLLHGLHSVAGLAGNLTTDAHLAALAIENGCELCTTDGDFARFAGLRWSRPLHA